EKESIPIECILSENNINSNEISQNLNLESNEGIQGVVIVAVKESERRNIINQYLKSKCYIVYDVMDILLLDIFKDCLENGIDDENLIMRCRICRASARSCPVRRSWYRLRGLEHNKVIRHIAIRAGTICNLKCKHCCEFVPYYKKEHMRKPDYNLMIEDIN